MKLKGGTIFILMQVFFVIFGFALYFGLKSLKESKAEDNVIMMERSEGSPGVSAGSEVFERGVAAQEFDMGKPGVVEGHPGMDAGSGGGYDGPPADIWQNVECDFPQWIGKEFDEEALKATGRPYRILPPGSMMTMDYNPERINVQTDKKGVVLEISCG